MVRKNYFFDGNPINESVADGQFGYNDKSVKEFCRSLFIEAFRRVVTMLRINTDDPMIAEVVTANFRNMAAEIEMNLDEFLENVGVPFRTEEFLLILFQELYETFIMDGNGIIQTKSGF